MEAHIIKAYFAKITSMLSYFTLSDYLILISLFLTILIFFLLSVVFRLNRIFAFLLLLTSVVLFFTSPVIYEYIMEKYIKTIEFTLNKNEKLQYNDFYYVEGSIKNIGEIDFKGCIVSVNFIPRNTKHYRYIKYRLIPSHIHYENYKNPLNLNDSMNFNIVIPSPNPQVDYTLETKGVCY